MTSQNSWVPVLASLMRWERLLVVQRLIGGVIGTLLSSDFLTSFNFTHMPTEFMFIGVMILPMTMIIISGNIDLSVDSTIGLTGTVLATVWAGGWDIWASSGVALLVGAAAGFFNGIIITRLKLPSLLVTLGSLPLYRGLDVVTPRAHSL